MAAAVAAATAALLLRGHRPRYSFRDRVVLITGGARGLGLALARVLADEGALLLLLSRSGDEMARVVPDLRARGASVGTVVCDVRDPSQVDETVRLLTKGVGRIDVMINNAGIIQSMPFEHAQMSDYADSLATHFWGPLHFIRACLPVMKKQGHGRIVNIASIGGRIGVPHLTPYCAGKFALVGLSEALHAELRKDNIVVTTVTPGLMRTGSARNVFVRGQRQREARWFSVASATPLTSISAERAARQILGAVRDGRARISPGWQARVGELTNVVAPELFAATMSMVASSVLPGPTGLDGDQAEQSRNIDLGWLESVLPVGPAVRLNQDVSL